MRQVTVTLSDVEFQALESIALSAQDWIENVSKDRCRSAMDNIISETIKRCLDEGVQIPASRDEIVALAFQQGWEKSAVAKNAEYEAMVAAEQAAQQQGA